MEESEISQMERNYQVSESPRWKREQSENRKNKKRITEEDSQQMSDIKYSNSSTFVKGFTPPDDTIEAQRRTDIILEDVKKGEDTKKNQR